MVDIDTACRVAGGRPGGGSYIFVQDFSGDGLNDYLISEGNYNCIGKPDAFRAGGKAMVEIYVTSGGDAFRGFYEVVRGYRILDTRPRTVQIVRDGAACGGALSATCTVTLRWDPPSRKFTAASASSSPITPSTDLKPPNAAVTLPAGVLTAAEVNSQAVGRKVQGDGTQWLYYSNGKYESDDGRVARSGTYVVRPDGRLCWNDRIGVSGCFQYYRQAGKLHLRRADPDNTFALGPITVGSLPR
ncbi:hypothetical protein [Reyranella soli]|nr:hypothetical protein [Reyranella soli]